MTGASSGIGRAFAERLARDGYDLLLTARRRERLEELARDLGAAHGVRVDVEVGDLTEPAFLRAFAARLSATERLRLFVNNAGSSTFGRFHELDVDAEAELVALLVLPTVRLTHAALNAMGSGGAIVHISSRAALQPHPEIATYSGAKAFVNGFAQALRADPGGPDVQQLVVCPGLTRTELFDAAGIDVSAVDPRSWIAPERVVDDALRDLDAGEHVCVPGVQGRGEWLRRWIPRGMLQRTAGVLRRLARV